MTITGKLIISYLGNVLLVLLLGAYSIYSLSGVNQNGTRLHQQMVLPLTDLVQIGKLSEQTRVQMVSSVLNRDPSFVDKAEQNITAIQASIDSYEKGITNEEEKKTFQDFLASWHPFTDIVKQNITLIRNGKYAEAEEGLKKGGVPYAKASNELAKLTELKEKLALQLTEQNEHSYSSTRFIIIAATIVAMIVAITIGFMMGRYVGKPIRKIVEQVGFVANGNLSLEPMVVKHKDELGQLANAINQMVQKLRQLILQVSHNSEQVAAASEELTASAEQNSLASEQISGVVLDLLRARKSK